MAQTDPSKRISAEEIRTLLHENVESGFSHTSYAEESLRFHYLLQGDPRAVEETDKILDASIQGMLSKDPLRNFRYLFIVNTGLVTRYVIEAGLPQEQVYAISDLYIQKADVAKTIEEIKALNRELWSRYVDMVKKARQKHAYSKTMRACLDYIDLHFNEKLTLAMLGKHLDLNPCYLATLFKKEMGETFGSYLMGIRIKTAKALLTRTEYSYSQIAYSLAFCSQSHFIKCFREQTHLTPMQYRMQFWEENFASAQRS